MSRYRQDVRKAVGRLTSKAAVLQRGGGGGSDETPALIAMCVGAAAGNEGERRAVALFCLKHWPGYAQLAERVITTKLKDLQIERVVVRLGRGWSDPVSGEFHPGKKPHPAPIVHRIARSAIQRRVIVPPSLVKTRVLQWLELQIRNKVASTGDWPPIPPAFAEKLAKRTPPFWRTFTETVFTEFLDPAGCRSCGRTGKKATLVKASEDGPVRLRETACPDCSGKGLVERGQGRRAVDLSMRKQDFAAYLEPAYRYLWLRTLQYEHTGAQLILSALREEDDD